MPEDLALFDVDEPSADLTADLDLRDDPAAWASCRYCHTLTTAHGIDNRGHGPEHRYRECDRMHDLFPVDLPDFTIPEVR